jgi:DNA-binding FadR family transcriptional regulator
MIGMVLEAERVSISDLTDAIDRLEPMCGRECARRAGEDDSVVKGLQELVEQSAILVDDRLAFLESCRRFHDAIIRFSGNRTLSLVAGALVELWSDQQLERGGTVDGDSSKDRRRGAVREHQGIVDAIRRGDGDETSLRLQAHLRAARDMIFEGQDEGLSSRLVVAGRENLAWSELRHRRTVTSNERGL